MADGSSAHTRRGYGTLNFRSGSSADRERGGRTTETACALRRWKRSRPIILRRAEGTTACQDAAGSPQSRGEALREPTAAGRGWLQARGASAQRDRHDSGVGLGGAGATGARSGTTGGGREATSDEVLELIRASRPLTRAHRRPPKKRRCRPTRRPLAESRSLPPFGPIAVVASPVWALGRSGSVLTAPSG
jgi:hypothetical protein